MIDCVYGGNYFGWRQSFYSNVFPHKRVLPDMGVIDHCIGRVR